MNLLIVLVKKYWIGCLLFLVAMLVLNYLFGTVCFSRILIGLPCPACGITRAAILMMRGHFRESLKMHPLLPLVIIAVIGSLITRIKVKNYMFFIRIYVIITVVIFVVVYIYRMRMYFPATEPMTYRQGNCMQDIIYLLRLYK